jgi:hypothetical protein
VVPRQLRVEGGGCHSREQNVRSSDLDKDPVEAAVDET